MLETILEKNGPADAMPVFRKEIMQAASMLAFETVAAAIHEILDAGDDHARRNEALIEPMTIGLEDPDPKMRTHASAALRHVRIAKQPSPRTLAALETCLRQWHSYPEAAHNSANVLWNIASEGHDISLAIDALKLALANTDHRTREAASEALSEYYRKTGAEPLIKPDYHVLPDPRRPEGHWELAVKYRRTHAMSDDPVDKPCPGLRCAACRIDQTTCIWYEECLGIGLTLITAEIFCRACGKYSGVCLTNNLRLVLFNLLTQRKMPASNTCPPSPSRPTRLQGITSR